jgi:hypothetical protein
MFSSGAACGAQLFAGSLLLGFLGCFPDSCFDDDQLLDDGFNVNPCGRDPLSFTTLIDRIPRVLSIKELE